MTQARKPASVLMEAFSYLLVINMDNQYDAQIYSLASGWFQDRFVEDYVYSTQYSAKLLPFITCLQQIVLGLLADPNYREDF